MTTISQKTALRQFGHFNELKRTQRKPLGWGAVSVIFSAALVAAWVLGSVMGWPV